MAEKRSVLIDAVAVQKILNEKLDISFVALNATNKGIQNTKDFKNKLKSIDNNSARLSYKVLERLKDSVQDKKPIWDLSSAVVSVERDVVEKKILIPLKLERNFKTDDTDTFGELIPTKNGGLSKVVLDIDTEKSEKKYFDTLKE